MQCTAEVKRNGDERRQEKIMMCGNMKGQDYGEGLTFFCGGWVGGRNRYVMGGNCWCYSEGEGVFVLVTRRRVLLLFVAERGC